MAPTTRLDLMSGALAADPWPALAELREQGPLVWHETHRLWLLTRDREIRQVVMDFRRFTLEGTPSAELFGAEAFISIDDRARHDALRGVWADAFRLPALEPLAPVLRHMIDDLLAPVVEELRAGRPIDLVRALCRPLPTLAIAHMMGVPGQMMDKVVAWSDQMAAGGPAYGRDASVVDAREAAKSALADYLRELMQARRRSPRDDLVSKLVHAEVAGGLTDGQIVENARQLLFAGAETTAKWLAQLFLTYGRRPDLQRQLAADRSLIPAANDEVMRWQGVVGTMGRRVRGGDVELGGVTLRDGDRMTCLLASAGRDPDRYEDPDTLDIYRRREPNLGFGVGLHHCLGINLAKLEAELAVAALLDRIPAFEIAAPCSFSSLPLRGPQPVVIARAVR